ncbi:MAG: metallophosphoesterase family protein [Pseudomonadales bacterium]|jgi:predicted phosphodiesterase
MKPARRIGLVGDVHAEDNHLKLAIDYLQSQEPCEILCTGDIVDGPGCPDTCVEILEQAGVKTVRGNHDRWLLEDKARHIEMAHTRQSITAHSINYLENLPSQIELATVAGTLLLCHGIGTNDLKKVWPGTKRLKMEKSRELDRIIASDKYRIIINGHMHFNTLINFDSLTLLNAGTITGNYWPNFSLLDFERWEIDNFIFEGDKVVKSATTHLASTGDSQSWKDTQSFTGDWQPVMLTSRV